MTAGDRKATTNLRVDVMVDLELGPCSGGHVKCWERIAEAATRLDDGTELTVHFSGRERQLITLSEHVRYIVHRPVFSTSRLSFLSHIPDHTDLAPYHPQLARALRESNVIHTTDAYFAFAKTALVMARRKRIPLVNSVHTDTPRYARLFTGETIRHLTGSGWLSRLLLDRMRIDAWPERGMIAKLTAHQRLSDFCLVSRPDELEPLAALVGPERVGLLRRGIDRQHFNPARRDRAWLNSQFGIAEDFVVVLFVGRINAGKNVMTLAAALRDLVNQGLPVQLLCAGVGEQISEVLAMLGPRATCPGALTLDTLARVYACADIFASPSRIEIFANVVMEALASGVPALVATESGMGRVLHEGRTGCSIAGNDHTTWSATIKELVRNPVQRQAMAVAARESALQELPSWDDVLRQDLLPVWRRVASSLK
ncbi:MAG: glycosyltransferase [Rhodospirillaceae bacterium]